MTAQSVLYFKSLADLFNKTPSWFFWEVTRLLILYTRNRQIAVVVSSKCLLLHKDGVNTVLPSTYRSVSRYGYCALCNVSGVVVPVTWAQIRQNVYLACVLCLLLSPHTYVTLGLGFHKTHTACVHLLFKSCIITIVLEYLMYY